MRSRFRRGVAAIFMRDLYRLCLDVGGDDYGERGREKERGGRSGPTNAPRKRGSRERANPEPMKKLAANKVKGGGGGSDAFAF